MVMPQIETVVFLMMENRSLDNVLGWLYDDCKPAVVYPPRSSPDFDSIPSDASNSYTDDLDITWSYSPSNGTAGFPEPCRVPAYDPHEPLPHVQKQLYANSKGQMPPGYFWSASPNMAGFVRDYHELLIHKPKDVMGAYSRDQLPVLYGLAENFAVSDRWFCSMPTQTDPNRAFSVCGTSLGKETNLQIDENTYKEAKTIFNALGNAGKTWGMYWRADIPLGTGEPLTSWAPFTNYYFSQINNAPNGGVDTYTNFLNLLAEGKAPNFCFLEPSWGGGVGDALDPKNWFGIQGNDYHPPAWVGPAEADLNNLYNALVSSPQWEKMLFVLTFDEHGGTYDHVPPTACLAPDGNVGQSGFKFDRLGVRVPMILVSPFIKAGTVFRAPEGSAYDFDHTSFIATMLKWAGVDPTTAGLGARVAVAPTFEDVLSDTAREDKPGFLVPADYSGQGGGIGHIDLGGLDLKIPIAKPIKGLDVHYFRQAIDSSLVAEDFVRWLTMLS